MRGFRASVDSVVVIYLVYKTISDIENVSEHFFQVQVSNNLLHLPQPVGSQVILSATPASGTPDNPVTYPASGTPGN